MNAQDEISDFDDEGSAAATLKLARAILSSSQLAEPQDRQRQSRNLIQLIDLAMRQIEHGPKLAALDSEAARKFGLDENLPVAKLAPALERVLAEYPDLYIEYLKQRTLIQLEVDNPQYWGYTEAKARWGT